MKLLHINSNLLINIEYKEIHYYAIKYMKYLELKLRLYVLLKFLLNRTDFMYFIFLEFLKVMSSMIKIKDLMISLLDLIILKSNEVLIDGIEM